jgi:hypothetical protein
MPKQTTTLAELRRNLLAAFFVMSAITIGTAIVMWLT